MVLIFISNLLHFANLETDLVSIYDIFTIDNNKARSMTPTLVLIPSSLLSV